MQMIVLPIWVWLLVLFLLVFGAWKLVKFIILALRG
jgi:hypothetical protein